MLKYLHAGSSFKKITIFANISDKHMKAQIFIIALCLALFSFNSHLIAQYADCTPDYTVEDPEGVGVRVPVDLPVGFLGEHYSTVFTIVAPARATTWGFINTTITKIQLTELQNLPSGLNQDSNAGNDDGFLYGGEHYCYTLDGYPVAIPGVHTVSVYANAWIRVIIEVQAPGNPQFGGDIYFTLCNELDLELGPNQTITTNDEITLSANQNNDYHTYAWSNGCTSPTCAISGSELGVGTHNVSVVVSDTVGTTGYYEGRETRCFKSDSISITVTEGNSINSNYFEQISVFPNPSTGVVSIEQKEPKEITISVTDIKGQETFMIVSIRQKQTIDLSYLEKGVYFVKLTGQDYTTTRKLILK